MANNNNTPNTQKIANILAVIARNTATALKHVKRDAFDLPSYLEGYNAAIEDAIKLIAEIEVD